MDGLHRRVETHCPAPEQAGPLGRRATIGDLVQLTVAAIAGHRQDGCAVHREQQRRAVEEGNGEAVERVVEQIAVQQGEVVGPVQVRENTERNRLAPAAHHDGTDEAQHQHQPDRRSEGPGNMGAKAQRPRAPIGPRPPQQHRTGQEEAGNLPPAALAEGNKNLQAPFRSRRLQRKPWQMEYELQRIPADGCPHVKAYDLDRNKSADKRSHPQSAQIDRSDLCVADLAQPIQEEGLPRPIITAGRKGQPHVGGRADLHLREEIVIAGHVVSPQTPGPA